MGTARRAHLGVLAVLQMVMITELISLVVGRQWLHVFLVADGMLYVLNDEGRLTAFR